MNKTEKIISSIFTIALGVLLIVMKGEMISVFMTVFGIALISLGVIELLRKEVTSAAMKIAIGGLIIFLGWALVSAVVYVLATLLVVVAVLTAYDYVKHRYGSCQSLETILDLIPSIICLLIGVILFFNEFEWCFVVAGSLTVFLGGFVFGTTITEK